MQLVSTSRRRWLSGWKLFGVTAVLLAGLFWFDGRLTAQAPRIGYCPDTADAIIYAPDFPRFWSDALAVEQLQRMRQDWTRAASNTGLSIHRLTGIRPTPGRWRLWMGRRFVASHGPEGRGVSTSPGLLLRLIGRLHGFLAAPDQDGIRAFGDVYYAWRDDCLIASTEPGYVRASLHATPVPISEQLSPRAAVFESRVSPEVKLEVHATNQFPIFGELPAAVSSRTAPMTLPNSWAQPPVAACSASTWADVASLLSVADAALTHMTEWTNARDFGKALLDEWGLGRMPEDWDDERLDHCALALTGIDTRSDTPYPSLAFVIRSRLPVAGKHPLLDVLPTNADPIPYEWGGNPGQFFPMTGPNWAPCLGSRGREWIATSREPLMRTLVKDLRDGPPVEADFTVQIDWQQVSSALVSLLGRHDTHELFEEMNRDDMRRHIFPMAQGLRHLGRAEVIGKNVGGRCTIEGVLARSVHETAS